MGFGASAPEENIVNSVRTTLRRVALALSLTFAALGATACGPDASSVVRPETEAAVEVDASTPAVGESESQKICNPDGTCCCWRDRTGEPHCYGRCQNP